MTVTQGDIALLQDPVAQALLSSRQPAHLAYTWTDGTPRVVPLCFHWTGEAFVFGTPPRAPKVKALEGGAEVAVTVDDASSWPYRALLVRGRATVELLDDIVPEYALATVRYFGEEMAAGWLAGLRGQPMARVTVTPEWAGVLDFETRFPSTLAH
jgi:hypothetical protein